FFQPIFSVVILFASRWLAVRAGDAAPLVVNFDSWAFKRTKVIAQPSPIPSSKVSQNRLLPKEFNRRARVGFEAVKRQPEVFPAWRRQRKQHIAQHAYCSVGGALDGNP